MNDDEMRDFDNIFARLDAWDPTTATQRIPATELPPEVIARVRKSMAVFRFGFGLDDLGRKQRKGFVCFLAKASKIGEELVNPVMEPCDFCKDLGVACLWEKTGERPILLPYGKDVLEDLG